MNILVVLFYLVSDHDRLISMILSHNRRDFSRILPRCNDNHKSSVNGLAAVQFAGDLAMGIVRAYTRWGADINVVDIHGRSPIHLVDLVVEALIDRHRRLVNFALAVLPTPSPLKVPVAARNTEGGDGAKPDRRA